MVGGIKSECPGGLRRNLQVALSTYAMTVFVLGFGDILGEILDPRGDDQGLLLDAERMPKRIRTPKPPRAL
jgi:hypothetical protein